MTEKRTLQEIFSEINYEESKVPRHDMLSALIMNNGQKVANAWEWMNQRRPEIMDFYRQEVFGELPSLPGTMSHEVLSCKSDALCDQAIRKEIRITFTQGSRSRSWIMLLYIPKNAVGPVPVTLGLNFKGNHTTTLEDDVLMTGKNCAGEWVDPQRGVQCERWEFAKVIGRGFASATVCYHDIFPDFACDEAWQQSIYSVAYPDLTPAQLHEKHSAISAWAWGLSRMLDVLSSEAKIDCRKAMVTGHSRLGKTSLWAGANDSRFQVVVSNDSGHGGAALFRRCLGENIEALVTAFPHWFVSAFAKYAQADANLQFDQNFLLALIAPRPLCIGSATQDLWADPRGEFLAGKYASEVYRLFGVNGMPGDEPPAADVNIYGEVSYHIRSGAHNILWQDWEHYLSVAGKVFEQTI
ncbi:MAG: acetylxylan esterase [Lentisphaerae bacterium]|nr:acetylxylan esterase [Lentisphaerota bacterium]